jgi:FtsZ-interacting cell division protein ZipA
MIYKIFILLFEGYRSRKRRKSEYSTLQQKYIKNMCESQTRLNSMEDEKLQHNMTVETDKIGVEWAS